MEVMNLGDKGRGEQVVVKVLRHCGFHLRREEDSQKIKK